MFPEFSRPGRSVLLAGALLSFLNGTLYSWSVFMLPLEQSTGWTRPQTSLVFTAILVFFGLGMMSGGVIMRRLGPRATAALGGLMLALGLAASSFASAPWQIILAYGGVAGFGIGMGNIVPIAVSVRWYLQQRGLVCGIMAFSLAFGTLLLGSGLAATLIDIMGVSATLLFMAALILAGALPASAFLKYPAAAAVPHEVTSKVRTESLTTLQMIKTKNFRLVWIWALAIQTGGLMIIGHIVPCAIERGASPAQAGLVMGICAVINGLGRLLFGSLFDAKGFRFAMLADVFCMIAGLLFLAFPPTGSVLAGILPGVALIALSFGGTIPQFSAYIASSFGPAHLENNVGMTATVFIIAGFAGPFAGGCLHSLSGSYQAAILAAAIMAAPGIFAILNVPSSCPK